MMDSVDQSVEERLKSERDFHNERFGDATQHRDQGKFYAGAMRGPLAAGYRRSMDLAAGNDVLELGCATGDKCIGLANVAKSVVGIDISDKAVEIGQAKAQERGLDNITLIAGNAEKLAFDDESFDLVLGTGIIHHLDLDVLFPEVARVLRPGGKAFFQEPLGHNPVINAYRNATPDARTPDEHPIIISDMKLAKQSFSKVDMHFYEMVSLAATPFRSTKMFGPVHTVLSGVDSLLFKIPGLRWWAWTSHIVLTK